MGKLRNLGFALGLASLSACERFSDPMHVTPGHLKAENEGYAKMSREFLWGILSKCPMDSDNMPKIGEIEIGERYTNCIDVDGDQAVDLVVVHSNKSPDDKYCYIDDQNSPQIGVIRGALCDYLEKPQGIE